MGLGDAKLIMLAGAWFGWSGAVVTLFLAAPQSLIGSLVIYLTVGKLEEPAAVRADREVLKEAAAQGDAEAAQILADDPIGDAPAEGLGQSRLPFGPYLILALFELLFFGERLEHWYRHFIWDS